MTYRLFSKELTEHGIQECNADAAHVARAALLTGRVVVRALNAPDGKDVQIAYLFDKGRCAEFEFEEGDTPAVFRETPFSSPQDGVVRVTATYDTWVKLDKGETTPAEALRSSDYQVEGNLLLLMPLSQAINSWTAKVQSLPKSY